MFIALSLAFCKSVDDKYTDGHFVHCKDLLPKEEETLFETSILKDIRAQQQQILKN